MTHLAVPRILQDHPGAGVFSLHTSYRIGRLSKPVNASRILRFMLMCDDRTGVCFVCLGPPVMKGFSVDLPYTV